MSNFTEQEIANHIHALERLRVGVELDANVNPNTNQELAAIDAGIAALRTASQSASSAITAEHVRVALDAFDDEFNRSTYREMAMRAALEAVAPLIAPGGSGEAVAWTVVGPDGKSSIGGWQPMQSHDWAQQYGTLREGHRYAYAYESPARAVEKYPDATGWHGPGHARLGDPCPSGCDAKLIGKPSCEGDYQRLHCEKCGKGSWGLHTPPATARAGVDWSALSNAADAVVQFAAHSDCCGDHDAYNNAEVPTCGCGMESARERLLALIDANKQESV